MHRLVARLLPALVLAGASVSAAAVEAVDRLLAASEPPPGVVFEVVTGDESALEAAMPRIREQARRLRERFPELPLVVLTHGAEQFSLLSDRREERSDLHALVRSFGADDGIPVQVCGNHASWRGKGEADFPGYVEVVSSAGSALADYRAAGYVVVLM